MNICITSPKLEIVGLCLTTHERVCEMKSRVSGHLGAVTQTDPCFGIQM